MKCPFCGQELNQDDPQSIECRNSSCKKTWFMYGSKELWQELIRTRKALDVAKSKLNGIHRLYSKAFYIREDWLQVCMEMVDKTNTALEQITALEQKDVK